MSPFRAAVAFRLMECIILISKFPSEFQLRLRFSLLSLIGRVSDHHNPVEPLGLFFFFLVPTAVIRPLYSSTLEKYENSLV